VTDQVQAFEAWALVEVMGHSRLAGKVTEQSIGGANFVRVDVPEVEARGVKIPAFTQLLGSSAIFRITITTEDTARKAAAAWQAAPFVAFEAPTVPALTHSREQWDEDSELE